jgi:hypothetical protein
MIAERISTPVLPAITPSLCQRCGACYSAVVEGELVSCQHLDTRNGFHCQIYATRPQVCRDYSCIRDGRIRSTALKLRVQAAIRDEAAACIGATS